MMKWLLLGFVVVALLLIPSSARAVEGAGLTEADIRRILTQAVDAEKRAPGIVVGIVDAKGVQVVAHGKRKAGAEDVVDGDTVFEIGSVTKVFTALLLQDMIERGEMKLDDPVENYLPKSVTVPSRGGRKITLLDLATHTSALPRMPDNFTPRDADNPYADYTVDQLYAFLSECKLSRDIGAKYEYSNLGMGLLGHVIGLKAGTNYESLARERICRPLKMNDTGITLSPELKARLATGHNATGEPVANWDIPTLAGAGALRSTVNDLLKFVAANLGLGESPLTPLMRQTQVARFSRAAPNLDIALAWHITHKNGADIIWHNGGTGGYHSFIGFDPRKQRGVVVLANSANSIDELALRLLGSKEELAAQEASQGRKAVAVDAKLLDAYVGQYELVPGAVFTIRRKGDGLTVQLTGQPQLRILPTSETNFFCTDVDAQITFIRDGQGKATKLILHQNGLDQTAPKTTDELPREREAVKLDPAIYDAYAGRYQLSPRAVFTIKRDGEKLMAQLTGQPFLQVFPESETNFFYKVVDAQLTFEKNAEGEVTSLVLHQNGADKRAKRIR